ncbi:glycosyltransferase family 39 protein [Arenibacter sp. GZD96]|uniref:ArnT family glycosyltransferase n=1 Tax=Aurantibrevibacter litoralis TaxID=3106030 RepID=UPI002AFF11D7|nr:glycosyltransferase family 39 protein [Arenibacter sp. GZD-96]MEA1787169.1 glycosyltransferase family 39 protein [Arenibacter sp. GZD-96]
MTAKFPKLLVYLTAALFAINLAQSYFTELIFDEAYYWYYAQQMAWGYFDHPPMVAWLIKIGGLIFPDELGVRFVSCVLSSGTVLILWLLADHPKKNNFVVHFFVLLFAMVLVNAYGFFTLPDTPLLFFSALFLYAYKKFLNKPSWLTAVALGLLMAALMYSKYHALLVIVFVFLSNVKLIFNKYAWLAVGVALLAFLPHLLWLLDNDFVSIKYHLQQRPTRAYSFKEFTLRYLINLIALFGLTFPWIYKALFATKFTDKFTNALLFVTYGVLLFFFVSSFSKKVQTQWLVVICIPLIVLIFRHLIDTPRDRKWLFRLGIANGLLLLYARFALIFPILSPVPYESHGNKKWVQDIKSKVGEMPVVFENSYRIAAMYAYYSGSLSYSFNNIRHRLNQYSIDDSEAKIQHQKILYVSRYISEGEFSFFIDNNPNYKGKFIDNFESYRKLRCFFDDTPVSLRAGEPMTMKVYNPYTETIPLAKLKFHVAYLNKYKRVEEILPLDIAPKAPNYTALKARDTTYFLVKMPKTTLKIEELAYLKIAISENGLYMGINSDNIKLN